MGTVPGPLVIPAPRVTQKEGHLQTCGCSEPRRSGNRCRPQLPTRGLQEMLQCFMLGCLLFVCFFYKPTWVRFQAAVPTPSASRVTPRLPLPSAEFQGPQPWCPSAGTHTTILLNSHDLPGCCCPLPLLLHCLPRPRINQKLLPETDLPWASGARSPVGSPRQGLTKLGFTRIKRERRGGCG